MFSANHLSAKYVFRPKNGPVPDQNSYVLAYCFIARSIRSRSK